MKFFIHFLKELKKTGAVAPSSKFLAKRLTHQLHDQLTHGLDKSLNVLEIGAGTGSLTKEIVKNIRPQDHLDAIEIQKGFFEIIQKKYAADNVQIHCSNFLNFNPNKNYDFIFSSLPYENMDPQISKKIWEKKLKLCAPGSYICYFKYVNIRNFKSDFEEKIVEKYINNKKIVFRNLPPAKLYTLQVDKSTLVEA